MINEIRVLDHGFVRLLNAAGPTRRGAERPFDADDTDPANVARMSFAQKDSGRTREQDLRLAHYLAEHHHDGPFEFIQVYLEMKLPIFIARQLVRHRTASLNEVSARYTTLPPEWYVPAEEQIGGKAPSNKQGRGAEPHPDAQWFRNNLNITCRLSYDYYQEALQRGVAPELARLFLHTNIYTQWVWSQNLRNLAHLLRLRLDSHAQWETRQYAQAIYRLLHQHLPATMELLVEEPQ